jgi:hypothetical protein
MNAVRRAGHLGIAVLVIFAIIAGLVGLKGSYLFRLVFVGVESLGRIYLVTVGIAPSKGGDAVKFVIGGVTVIAVMLYAWSQWKNTE